MKTMVPLLRSPNHKFDGVASQIAQGDPPKWLVLGLTQFSGSIGVDTSDVTNFDTIIEQMQGAVHILTTWLPIWNHGGFGLQCPKDVAVVLDALPRIKADLDISSPKSASAVDLTPNVKSALL